jgi:hypothetical protein
MTYAMYFAHGYSREKFESKSLDYTLHSCAAEIWGLAENVKKGIQVHNRVIEALSVSEKVPLVDQQALIPKAGIYFNDVCHLTQKGCDLFVDHVLEGVTRILDRSGGPASS